MHKETASTALRRTGSSSCPRSLFTVPIDIMLFSGVLNGDISPPCVTTSMCFMTRRVTSGRRRTSAPSSSRCSCVSVVLIAGVVSKVGYIGGASAFLCHPTQNLRPTAAASSRTRCIARATPSTTLQHSSGQLYSCNTRHPYAGPVATNTAPSSDSRCRRRRAGIGGLGAALRATVAPWQAVDGEQGGRNGRGGRGQEVAVEVPPVLSNDAGGSGGGEVLLREQDGPAWTEIVWDEVRGVCILCWERVKRKRGACVG